MMLKSNYVFKCDICEDHGPSSRMGTWPRSPISPVQSSTPTKRTIGMDMSVNISPIGSPEQCTSPNPEVEYPPRMNNIAASYRNVPYTENVRNMLSNIRINELAKTYTPVQTSSQSNLDQHLSYLQNKYPALRKDSSGNTSPVTGSNSPSPTPSATGSLNKINYNPYASIRRTPAPRSVSVGDRLRPISPSSSERSFSSDRSSTRSLSAGRPLSPSAADRLFPNPQNRPLSPIDRPMSPSASERLFPNGTSRPTTPLTTSEKLHANFQRALSPTRKSHNDSSRPRTPVYKGPPAYQSPVRRGAEPVYSSVRKVSSPNRVVAQPRSYDVPIEKSPISDLDSEYIRSIQKTPSPRLPHSKSEGFLQNRAQRSSSKSFDSLGSQNSSPDVTNHPEQTKSSEPDLINNTQHSLSRFIRNSVQSKSVNYGKNKIQEMSKIPDKIKQTSRLEFKNLLTKVGWSSSNNKVSAAERLKAKNVSVADRLKERTPTPRKKFLTRSNSSLSSSIHNSSEPDEEMSSDSCTSVNTVRTRLDFNNIEVKPALAKVNNGSRSSSLGSSSELSLPKSTTLVTEQMKAFATPSAEVSSSSPKVAKSPALETAL